MAAIDRGVMRALVALMLLVTPAFAGNPGPCPSFTAGWSLSSAGPITGILYDQNTSQMYVIWNYTFTQMFYPVPLSLLQTFSRSQNWTATYYSTLAVQYEAVLLQEKNNCPVLQENGKFIWVN